MTAGVKVPKLGSIQDRTLRAYMQKRAGKEIAQTRLLAQIAVAQGNSDKSWARTVTNIWTDFLRSTYHLDNEKENTEQAMLAEYKKFKHLKPEVKIDKSGAISVSGIPNEVL